MTFSALNAAAVDLRGSLSGSVGPDALAEVSLRPPVDGGGEISFVRLVAWSYVLLFEAGRVSVPFLLRTASAYETQRESLDLVRTMRTWSFHNLGLTSDRDMELSRVVHRWFHDTCGEFPPDTDDRWNRCFEHLCDLVLKIVQQCQSAVSSVLLAGADSKTAINDLKSRVERSWPPHRFDELLSDASFRLGVRVDIVRFRTPRLGRWRSSLDVVHKDDDPVDVVTRVIEKDLLEHSDRLLPISGRDVMELMGTRPGPEVGAMLRHARDLVDAGVRNKEDLLEALEKLAPDDERGATSRPTP